LQSLIAFVALADLIAASRADSVNPWDLWSLPASEIEERAVAGSDDGLPDATGD
jgi:hypothetical protein